MTDDRRASANRRAIAITVVAIVILVIVAAVVVGKAAAPGSPTFPPIGATTPPAGPAAASTRSDITTAMAGVNLQVEDVGPQYRPAEAPRVAAAPKLVIRAIIPGDPDHGRIVIYEFLSTADATTAAQEQAAYLASGVGRVQFTPDTQFTIRVVGQTVVFYSWAVANSPDPTSATAVSSALETLGFGVPVPS